MTDRWIISLHGSHTKPDATPWRVSGPIVGEDDYAYTCADGRRYAKLARRSLLIVESDSQDEVIAGAERCGRVWQAHQQTIKDLKKQVAAAIAKQAAAIRRAWSRGTTPPRSGRRKDERKSP